MEVSKTLILSKKEIQSFLNMEKTFEVVEKVFKAWGEKNLIMPAKVTLNLGEYPKQPLHTGWMNAMPAYIGFSDYAGIKWVGGFKDNYKRGLPYIMGSLILNNPESGEVLSFMDASCITELRTGAATGVAVKYLSKENEKVLGVIGAGVQGRRNLEAIKLVRDIKEVKVTDIRKEVAEEYAKEMGNKLSVRVKAVKTNEEVCKNADIIVTVTMADEPLVMKRWLKPGVLIISLGSYQELEEPIPLSSKKLIVDSWEQAMHRGELVKLVSMGKINQKNIYAELGEIVAHKKLGRENDTEIICVCLIGLGCHDIAVAGYVYEEAKRKNLGEYVEI